MSHQDPFIDHFEREMLRTLMRDPVQVSRSGRVQFAPLSKGSCTTATARGTNFNTVTLDDFIRAAAAFPLPPLLNPSDFKKASNMTTSARTFKNPTNGKTYKVTGTDASKVKVGDLLVGQSTEKFKEVLAVGRRSYFARNTFNAVEGSYRLDDGSSHYTVTEHVTETFYKLTYDDGSIPSAVGATKELPPHYGSISEGFIGWLEHTKVNGKVAAIKFVPYVSGQGS